EGLLCHYFARTIYVRIGKIDPLKPVLDSSASSERSPYQTGRVHLGYSHVGTAPAVSDQRDTRSFQGRSRPHGVGTSVILISRWQSTTHGHLFASVPSSMA